MKFQQTSRGCCVEFIDHEQYEGRTLFLVGERFSNGYYLGTMQWLEPFENVLISTSEEERLRELIKNEGTKQGIVIEYYEVDNEKS
jgi:hypothetical protein